MSWIAKAVLAAALLNCGLSNVSAQEAALNPVPKVDQKSDPKTDQKTDQKTDKGQWLKDGACAVFSADGQTGDTVRWTGSCVDGYADGLGTATFTHDGHEQSFTAIFTHGVIPDGHVITRWGAG